MGRVQDAMRRAASEAAAASTETTALPDGAAAAEAFPDEVPATDEPLATADVGADAGSDPAGDTELRPPVETSAGAAGPAPAPASDADGEPVSHLSPTLAAKAVVDTTMAPSSREQYRRLAASLHHAQEATGLKVIMIASALAGEGKSLTAANLAMTFSESFQRRVLLIDGDLRRPALHTLFGITPNGGLSHALGAVGDQPATLYDLSARLSLLPAGQATSDPMAGLTSARMRALLEEARARFDWVIIDTPPIGVLSDANLLGAMIDGALLVIKAESTSFDMARRAADAIGRDRVLGAILNRVTEMPGTSYYEYYNYYVPRAQEGA